MRHSFKLLAAAAALTAGALCAPAMAQSLGVAINAPIRGGGFISLSMGPGGVYYAPPGYAYGNPPPMLYEQDMSLAPGYYWTPGHWVWTRFGYRWVGGFTTRDTFYAPPLVIYDQPYHYDRWNTRSYDRGYGHGYNQGYGRNQDRGQDHNRQDHNRGQAPTQNHAQDHNRGQAPAQNHAQDQNRSQTRDHGADATRSHDAHPQR